MGSINHVTLYATMVHAYTKIVRIQSVLVEAVLSKNQPTPLAPVVRVRLTHVEEPHAVVGGTNRVIDFPRLPISVAD